MPPPAEAGFDPERYRPYLELLARRGLAARLRGKADASGVVQQTLLEAHRGWTAVAGRPAEAQTAWLRRLLVHNLRDEARKWDAAARDVRRERRLEAAVEDSSSRLEACLAVAQSSPSQRAARAEDLVHLAAALRGLPEDQRRAVELHHLQ